jgi:PAS domain-containing protein
MNARVLASRRPHEADPGAVLDLLADSETPALATDGQGHVVSWNRAAERVFGRSSSHVLGRRCYDVICGRDVFGNRFCYENCAVLSMTRKGESVRSFEMAVEGGPGPLQARGRLARVPRGLGGGLTAASVRGPRPAIYMWAFMAGSVTR